MPEKINAITNTLKNVDLPLDGPISKDDLHKLFKEKVLTEFPTGIPIQDSRITITIDTHSAPAAGPK